MKKKKIKSKQNSKKFIFRLFFSILIILLVMAGVVFYFCSTDFFVINEILVEGNSIVKEDTLSEYADHYIKENGFEVLFGNIGSLDDFLAAFALRDNSIENDIRKDNAYISNVKVNIKPPDILSISVLERKSLIVLEFIKSYVLADENLIALEIVEEIGEKIFLQDIDVKRVVLGEVIDIGDSNRKILISIFEQFVHKGRNIGKDIKSINISDELIIINLENNVEAILSENEDLEYNLKFLNEIYYERQSLVKDGIIDFTKGDSPILSKK